MAHFLSLSDLSTHTRIGNMKNKQVQTTRSNESLFDKIYENVPEFTHNYGVPKGSKATVPLQRRL